MTDNEEQEVMHVYPTDDLKEHELNKDCWCRPILKQDAVYVHNSLDRREDYEKTIN